MVGGPVEFDAGFQHTAEGIGKGGTGGVEDSKVVEAGSAGCGRLAAKAFPGIQADVMVIATSGDEGRLAAVTLSELKAEDAAVEIQGAIQVGDFQVDVADADAGMDDG